MQRFSRRSVNAGKSLTDIQQINKNQSGQKKRNQCEEIHARFATLPTYGSLHVILPERGDSGFAQFKESSQQTQLGISLVARHRSGTY